MGCVRRIKTVIPFILVIMIIGCNSKQDKPVAGVSSGQKPGASALRPASTQDKADARATADQVLKQFQRGEFSQIYTASAAGFKLLGSESQFVAKFQQTRQNTGALKNPRELSFDSRPDSSHVIVYRLENDLVSTDLRLTLTRNQNGKMELAGLNQHDDRK